MGSLDLEEEELLQMVHDFIESESSIHSSSSPSSSSTSAQKHAPFAHSTRSFSLQEILRKKTEKERRIVERVGKHMRKKMELEKTSVLKQWLVKCLQLDGFHASLSHTSWVTTPACPCGNYEYIEVVDSTGSPHRIIVDIDFKSQFEVARPTQSYKELSSKLPTMFVGSEDKLKHIISLLCSAAEESLKERGLHIPPWRRPTYMQSKWKLSNCTNNYREPKTNITINNYPKISGNVKKVPSKFGEWVPQTVMMKGRRREMDGGSGISNQFSNMSINCC